MCRPPQLVPGRVSCPNGAVLGQSAPGTVHTFCKNRKVVCMQQPSPFQDEYHVEESHGLDANCRRGLAAAQLVSVRARASYWGNKIIGTTSLWIRSHTEKTKDLNAPLAPDMPAGDESFNFRPLTEEEKKEFMGSLDAKGRQMVADPESPPEPVRARRKIAVPGRNRT